MGNKMQILAVITGLTVIVAGTVIVKSITSDRHVIKQEQNNSRSESVSSGHTAENEMTDEDNSIVDDENFQQNAPNMLFHYASGMEIGNFQDSYVYDGSEIMLSVTINNFKSGFDESFLLYVNGFQNPYHTDFDETDKLYHTISIPDEESVTVEIYFTPMNCNIGDTVLVSFDRIMNMDFMLPDTSWVSFYPNHELNGINPFPIEIKAECGKTDNISVEKENKWNESDIPPDIFEEFNNTDEFGSPTTESGINEASYFDLVQNDRYEGYYVSFDKGLELSLNGYGRAGKYRVGIYLDHELIPAFDDNFYSDMEIVSGKVLSRKISIDTLGLEGLHHLYAIAIPIEDKTLATVKTKTKLLNIEEALNLGDETTDT